MRKVWLMVAACAALAGCRADNGDAQGIEKKIDGHDTNAGQHPDQGPNREDPGQRDINSQNAPFGANVNPDQHKVGDEAAPNQKVPGNDDLRDDQMKGSLDGGVPKTAPPDKGPQPRK